MVIGARLLACRDLDRVARLVSRQPRFAASIKALRATRTKEHHYLLCPPATVALSIALLGLRWPDHRPFRLLLLGSGRDDFVDDGQWYRFVPPMLGHKLEIAVHAFDLAGPVYRSRAPHVLSSGQAISVAQDETSFGAADRGGHTYDLAIAFSPLTWWGGRPESNQRLLRDLQALRASGVPLVFAASSSSHALLLHALLAAFSAEARSLVRRNPFALVSKRVGEQFGRTLSFVAPTSLPGPGAEVDDELLELLVKPAEVVLSCHQAGNPSAPWPVGTPVDGRLVHTLGGVAVDLDTLQVQDLSTEKPLGCLDREYRRHFEDYDPEWSDVERFIWAGHVRYIAAATEVAPIARTSSSVS